MGVDWGDYDNDGRFDLLHGELLSMSPTGGEHGEIASDLLVTLGIYVRRQRLGKLYIDETGFLLARNPDTVLCPDIGFVRTERLPPRQERKGRMPLAPDLAVEIRSPTDRRPMIEHKVAAYQAAGVPLIWVIEPAVRRIMVYTLGAEPRTLQPGDTLTGGDLLPGFATPVADVFEQ